MAAQVPHDTSSLPYYPTKIMRASLAVGEWRVNESMDMTSYISFFGITSMSIQLAIVRFFFQYEDHIACHTDSNTKSTGYPSILQRM